MIRLVACADLMITLYTRRGEFTIHRKKCTALKITRTGWCQTETQNQPRHGTGGEHRRSQQARQCSLQ